MNKELITLFGRVSVPGDKGDPVHMDRAAAINLEASLEGFTLSPDVLTACPKGTRAGYAARRP